MNIRNPSVITWLYALTFEMSTGGSQHRIRGLFERALENDKLHNSVILWRCFIEYERSIACNISGAKRVFFRAIHACPWYDFFDKVTLLGAHIHIREDIPFKLCWICLLVTDFPVTDQCHHLFKYLFYFRHNIHGNWKHLYHHIWRTKKIARLLPSSSRYISKLNTPHSYS